MESNAKSPEGSPTILHLLAVPLTLVSWVLRVAARTINLFSLAFRGLAIALEFIKGRFFLFRIRPDDIFVAAYPRSGTTLTQMILYQLTTDGSMDFSHISDVCPWFERTIAMRRWNLEAFSSPRVLKTHLAYRMVPKGDCRYIYVVRDGRDVAVSYYHMLRSHTRLRGSFSRFFSRFMRGHVPWGSWFRHVSRWRANRKGLRILFLTFEELVQDVEGAVRKIAAFCDIEIPPTEMPRILERCSFDSMKRYEVKFDYHTERLLDQGLRPNAFIREGRTGSGAAALDEGQLRRFDGAHLKWFGSASPFR